MNRTYLWRLQTVMLTVALCVALTACGDDGESSPSDNNNGSDSGLTVGFEAVDLGLSVKWANMNVGATAPWEFGSYFAWGEYKEKATYTEDNYNGPKNRTVIAGSTFDAATWALHDPWRMPTEEEIQELIDNCTYEVTTVNNVKGGRFTAKNGNSIFLPAAGWKLDKLYQGGDQGGYWAGTGGGKCGLLIAGSFLRAYTNWTATTGMPIRAVIKVSNDNNGEETNNPDGNTEHHETEDETNLPSESKLFVGYWANSASGLSKSANLFLSADGRCIHVYWYMDGKWSYDYTYYRHVVNGYYWSYDKDTKLLATTVNGFQFPITLSNEYAWATTTNNWSWSKISDRITANFLLEDCAKWFYDSTEQTTLEQVKQSNKLTFTENSSDDFSYNYQSPSGSGTLTISNPYNLKNTRIVLTGAFAGTYHYK